MPWVIVFCLSWILFFVFVDLKTIKYNVFGGILAVALASIVDWGGHWLDLYQFHNIIIAWGTCSIFYKLGPVFTMGVLFVQLVPSDKWMQLINIIVFSVIYIMMEISIILVGSASYEHWHWIASFMINLLVFSSFTWVKLSFLSDNNLEKV